MPKLGFGGATHGELRDAAGLRPVRAALAAIGYQLAPEGPLDPALSTVLRAFQRHWRPEAISGQADAGTLGYGGTKASLIHASRVMATELGAFGIRVNVIAPSVVETDMAGLMDEAARRKLDDRSALPGTIQAGDVADLVAFLVSPSSAKVTGQVLRIDRGMPF